MCLFSWFGFWLFLLYSLPVTTDDDFRAPSSCTPCVAISVSLGLMFILTVVLLAWKWRQSYIEKRKHYNDEKELKKMEDLDKILPTLDEELKNKDEEHKDMTEIIEILKEVGDKVVRQKEQIIVQQQEAEKLMEENGKKFRSVEREVREKEGDKTANRAQGYLKLKEIKHNLEERKKEDQQLNMTTEILLESVTDAVNKTSEKKEQIERDMEQIRKQMEETERQREEIQRKLQSETTKLVN